MIRLCPNWIGGDDREFKGHGPQVYVTANLEVRNSTELWVKIYLDEKETESNWTECEGTFEKRLWTCPVNEKIIRIVTDKSSNASYTDTDYDLDEPLVQDGNLVSKFDVMGDTEGNDVGNCTDDDAYVSVYFNDIQIEVESSSLDNSATGHEPEFTPPGKLGTLKITWAGVIDNGEGDDCPHAPTGSMHVLIYPASNTCPGDRKSYDHTGYMGEDMILHGPTSGKFCPLAGPADREWLDGDAMQENLSIYDWRYSKEEIMIVIYESDPDGIGRSHDMMFCSLLDRESTLNGRIILAGSNIIAHDDAIKNCRKGNIVWYQDVWNGGLQKGIPSIFLQVATE